MLNDRQVASLLWVGIILVVILTWPTGRRSLTGVVRAFLSCKIWPVFALLALWSLWLVFIGRRIGVWTDKLAADTWYWFFTTAVVLFFNFSNASEEPDFFKRTAKKTFGFTLVLGFLSDLYGCRCQSSSLARASWRSLLLFRRWPRISESRRTFEGCLTGAGAWSASRSSRWR